MPEITTIELREIAAVVDHLNDQRRELRYAIEVVDSNEAVLGRIAFEFDAYTFSTYA